MNRRGFFASVLALVAARKFARLQAPAAHLSPAPLKRFDYGAPSVFKGDGLTVADYQRTIVIDARLLERHYSTYAMRMAVAPATFAPGWKVARDL